MSVMFIYGRNVKHCFQNGWGLPNFISNFLSDRSFNVRIGSTLSDTFEQEQGVPQGNILSPTLFNIKINNIVKCVRVVIITNLGQRQKSA